MNQLTFLHKTSFNREFTLLPDYFFKEEQQGNQKSVLPVFLQKYFITFFLIRYNIHNVDSPE